MDASAEPPFAVQVAEADGTVVVRARGELDLSNADQVEQAVLPALRDGRHVVLDLGGLTFLDSSGVRTIVEAHNAAGSLPDARFSLRRLPPDSAAQHVLEVSGIDAIVDVVE